MRNFEKTYEFHDEELTLKEISKKTGYNKRRIRAMFKITDHMETAISSIIKEDEEAAKPKDDPNQIDKEMSALVRRMRMRPASRHYGAR